MPRIVLHQWEISPFCGKVRAILEHKRLDYQVQDYPGLTALQARRLTPAGKLPVLDYDDERIGDSTKIAAFLEERHPEPPLVPTDRKQRAMVRVFEDWADESLYWYEVYLRFGPYPEATDAAAAELSEGRSGIERSLMRMVVPRMYGKKLQAQGLGRMERADVEAHLMSLLDDLDALLEDATFLVGDRKTIADIAVAAQIREMRRTSPLRTEIDRRTHVVGFVERIVGA